LAGRAKEKYPDDVEVETIYSGFLGFGHKADDVKPPNIAVDEKILGSEASFEDIEKVVIERRSKK
jgi:hypothetical protein